MFVAPQPTFQWTSFPNAAEYTVVIKRGDKTRLKLKLQSNEVCSGVVCTVDLSTYLEVKALKPGKTYTWFIRTDNEQESAHWTFTTVEGFEEVTPSPWAMDFISDTSNSRTWTTTETNAVASARSAVGIALQRRSAFPTDPIADVFNRIMINGDSANRILMIRAGVTTSTISFTDPNTGQNFTYGGIPINACIAYDSSFLLPLPPQSAAPKVIICDGNLAIDAYTIVHEFGHLFDYSTARNPANATSLQQRVDNTAVKDCATEPGTIMGLSPQTGIWTRGLRGWGSGPARQPDGSRLITNFQKNSDDNIVEASADMFLNWVYRSNAVGGKGMVSCSNTNKTHWNGPGFLNRNWLGQTSPTPTQGTQDNTLPGDQRHKWMHKQIKEIFVQHSSW